MRLTGNYTFQADQPTVWDVLMDPKAIANALPGVDELEPVEGETDTWRAEAKIGIASINGRFAGVVRLSEKSPPDQYRLSVNGEGQQSFIDGSALISLDYDEAEQSTLVNWEADANISGKLASIGQRVVRAAANMMSRRFFEALAKQIEPTETE